MKKILYNLSIYLLAIGIASQNPYGIEANAMIPVILISIGSLGMPGGYD